ncbi:SURF1 family protein [Mesorhizobium sp. LHD-90]|uniref:SURF1 family protein n=1 Tax=Mesorhizobium sp. LHD-90 TaxID=3071414 RepID=UPI0027E072FB|nr:SURF1 family protein [Mesorhizobium sp. LHD-90]MDQ6435966.1 SURF1 family protein [Mesorhizobium sp. LHD-90]
MAEAGVQMRAKRTDRPVPWLLMVLAVIAFAALVGLGSWQLQRMQWKEGLIATIHERINSLPVAIGSMQARYARTGDVDYWPVELTGTFYHAGERHFFATHEGRSGFYIYTPLRMAFGRYVFINRGFVPYDLKEPQRRQQTQVEGEVTIHGLARNPLGEKPSSLVPDNEPAKNIFYWKDLDAMEATANLPLHSMVMPFFIDADATPNPGGLPIGGVTMIDQPNNHLQYALTWYGLAGALVGVVFLWLYGRRKPRDAATP